MEKKVKIFFLDHNKLKTLKYEVAQYRKHVSHVTDFLSPTSI